MSTLTESREDLAIRRGREVDEVLARTGKTLADIEGKGTEPELPMQVGHVEFNDPNFRAASESVERNPALATALFGDENPANLNIPDNLDDIVYPWETNGEVTDLLNKIDQEPVPSAAQLADHVVEVVSQVVEQNTAGAAVNVADKLVPELGTVLQHRGPSAIAYGFPPAVDALITKAKLSQEQTTHLLSQFSNLFTLSSQMRARVETIEIRGAEDEASIAEAKECHKILRDERLNAEKRKKIIKEPYLRPSQLIDGVFRIWMDEIGPLEKTAKEKAEYIENIERERIAKLEVERADKLRIFEADPKMFPNLGTMEDVAFEVIYTGVRESYHTRKRTEEQAERDRVERERANEAERLRLQAVNEQLLKEKAEADTREAEQRRIAEEAKQKQAAAEAELLKQEDARKAEEARLAAELERKRLAPDKQKLELFVQTINSIEFPKVDPQFDALLALVDHDLQTACGRIQRHLSGVEVVSI